MACTMLILGIHCIAAMMAQETRSPNATNSTNDMYVIHATVYQVGIITNKTDDEIANMTGNQEALTFYHSNGSLVDLAGIPAPLVTNVTAQSVVGVAHAGQPWPALGMATPTVKQSENSEKTSSDHLEQQQRSDTSQLPHLGPFKRSLGNGTEAEGPSIKVVKETALIPPSAGLQSIGLPSLVGLNTSFDALPVPIPNTSIVRYAKVNTLVQSP